jgi:hypothetical protein
MKPFSFSCKAGDGGIQNEPALKPALKTTLKAPKKIAQVSI